MIGLSSFVFLISVTLNAYPETMNVGDIAFAVNFIVIFSVLFMAVGIYLAFSSKRMLRQNLQAWPYFRDARPDRPTWGGMMGG